jgi:adenylate kinase family enzyme
LSQKKHSMHPVYQRYSVVGTTGSGKSTLGKRLARRLGFDFIELDALHWEPGWNEAAPEVFRARVETATQSEGWVCAGNYHAVREVVWGRAQACVWLDFPFPTIFWRLLKRTIRRAITREVLWNGNVEPFWPHLKLWSNESLFNWLFKTYWRRKREYPYLFALPEYTHLYVIHLKTPGETESWLSGLERFESANFANGREGNSA